MTFENWKNQFRSTRNKKPAAGRNPNDPRNYESFVAIDGFCCRRSARGNRISEKSRGSSLLAVAERVAEISGSVFAADWRWHTSLGCAARWKSCDANCRACGIQRIG